MEFRKINLVQDTHNNEKKLTSQDVVSAEQVNDFNKWFKQPEFRTILREPVKSSEGSLVNCPDYSSPRYTSPKAPNQISPSPTGK